MASKPITVTDLEDLKSNLHKLYHEIERLMISRENVAVIKNKVPDIAALFGQYSTANEAYIEDCSSQDDCQKVNEVYQSELIGYQELNGRIQEWLTSHDSDSSKSLSTKSRSKGDSTVRSFASSKSSFRCTEAIARRELARVNMQQQAEKAKIDQRKQAAHQEAERLRREADQEADQAEAQLKFEAACVEADVWERGSQHSPYETMNQTEPQLVTIDKTGFITPQLDSMTGPSPTQPPLESSPLSPTRIVANNASIQHERQRPKIELTQENAASHFMQGRYQDEPRVMVPLQVKLPQQDFVPQSRNLENQNCRDQSSSMPDMSHLLNGMATIIKEGIELPRPELLTFGGSSREYTRFINSFDMNIDRRILDYNTKLTYLIQYCVGEAKEMITHCATLPLDQGYQKAREILFDAYGKPFGIAREYVERLTAWPRIKHDDYDALVKFSRALEECLITLTHLKQFADIDNFDNIVHIACKLPVRLQNRWEEDAARKEASSISIRFHHLVEFVKSNASITNTPYSKAMRAQREKEQFQSKQQPPQMKRKVFAHATAVQETKSVASSPITSEKVIICPNCKKHHKLLDCWEFKKKSHDDRLQLMRKARLCDNCFTYGHMSKSCYKTPACTVEGCTYKHHVLLHKFPNEVYSSTERGKPNSNEAVDVHANTTVYNPAGTFLNIVPVIISSVQGREVKTHAFLDEGSTACLADKRLMDLLGLKGEKTKFSLTTVNDSSLSRDGYAINICVKSLDRQNAVELSHVLTVDKLPVMPNSMPHEIDMKKYRHLDGVEFPTIPNKEVMLMIGANVPEVFWSIDERRGRRNEPMAKKSVLGWSLFGPTFTHSGNARVHANYVSAQEEPELGQQIKCLWESDFKDASLTPIPSTSKEDKYALQIMNGSVEKIDGHYQLPLPWRPGCPELPDNRSVAMKRLFYLGKKLINDDDLKLKYCETMQKYIDSGFARKIPEDEIVGPVGATWYLPHHPVTSESKPGKVRVVFDAASGYMNTSLNTQLLQGPDTANSLLGVFLRFREHPIGIVSDIDAMFHQVKVHPKDHDSLRFLWWPNGDLTKEPVEHQMVRHLFGATSSPFCANLSLKMTAEDNSDNFDEDVVNGVKRNFYVDDYLNGASTVNDGIRIVKQTSELVECGGFHLSKWQSNNEEVMNSIPVKDRANSAKSVSLKPDPVDRVLGIKWDIPNDCFGFNINVKLKPATKRGILSVLSSIFDPSGIVSPVILKARMLLQNLCRSKYGWDEPITENEEALWRKWLESITDLSQVNLSRCYKPIGFGEVLSYQLHQFADASAAAYGVVSYLRLVNNESQVHVAFLLGKARLAPLKAVSIPRLELTAAALAVKLDMFLKRELDIPLIESVFWTDSTSVLLSINNISRRFPTFVANRLAKIEDGSTPDQWRYVPTELNPADDASRGFDVQTLINNSRWLEGPSFLSKTEDNWPTPPVKLPDLPLEFTVSKPRVAVHYVDEEKPLDRFIGYFSSWYKLKKASAWMIRFKDYLCNKKQPKLVGNLNVDELRMAELSIMKYVQKQEFSEVVDALSKSATLSNSGKQILRKLKMENSFYKLNPLLVDGLLRVGGRLRNATVEFDVKHPIILPSRHHITELIIREHHQNVHHSGMGSTWTSLRQRFWVIKGGATVRRVLGNCMLCKRRSAPVNKQLMADLPKERVTPSEAPFTNVGVDYFGHFLVKQGRSTVKRWGCIFTCMTTRAVHLEIAHSMDADSFINALRRFIARRGRPSKFFSDNGSNFTATDKILRKELIVWNSSEVGEFLRQKDIEFQFNPPTASNFGGFYERLIRSVRKSLNALLQNQVVSDEALNTIFCEIESQLNSRPITPISLDPRDEEPLSPNHLLLLRPTPNLPPGLFTNKDNYSRRRWRQIQYIADQFWIRWTKEYLSTLQERQKWTTRERNMEVSDLVLIVDNTIPRGKWLTGRIVETVHDKLGAVRQVIVKTSRGLLRRPITKLCLLLKANE